MRGARSELLTVEEAGRRLGVSRSTVWRLLRRGAVPSVRQRGRRLVPADAVAKRLVASEGDEIPPFTRDNPIFRLVGAGRGGGQPPGARAKHEILDR